MCARTGWQIALIKEALVGCGAAERSAKEGAVRNVGGAGDRRYACAIRPDALPQFVLIGLHLCEESGVDGRLFFLENLQAAHAASEGGASDIEDDHVCPAGDGGNQEAAVVAAIP